MKNNFNVLILDDDPDDVFLVQDMLSEVADRNYKIDVANTVEQADSLLADTEYTLLLCDYRLGSETGIDYIKTIRARDIDTPVILLTGVTDKSIDEEALKAGASDYINKADLSGPFLDKAIRYAVANASRQNLLSTVLSNVETAICVSDKNGKPELWNTKFIDVVSSGHSQEQSLDGIRGFVADAMASDKEFVIGDTTLEKNTAKLHDGRVVLTMHDVSAHVHALRTREEAENELAHQARHCPLTGLLNRVGFNEKIREKINQGVQFQLLIMDLNKFKEVNDVFGHDVGDELLQRVAKRLTACLSEDAILSRVGGDEFVALQIIDPSNPQTQDMAECFQRTLSQDFSISGRTVRIGVSIGISTFPENGNTSAELLSNADIAMYRAKAKPGSNIQFFDKKLDDATRKKRSLILDLREAIENNELDVHFQPLADVRTKKISSFEALARWTHPTLGPVRPDIFIELAEENGLIEELGKFVLRKACACAATWPEPVKVAVNVSGVQIRHSDIVGEVREALFQSYLPAHRLELEVTESVLLDEFDYSMHILRSLKNMGISLAMDDFGTGYSSLSSLISFPFDKLKIDRSFVTNLDKQQRLKNVVTTCIGLGKNLNMKMVAEGVERERHVEFLEELGCDEMQGFLIGKPMSTEDAHNYLLIGGGYVPMEHELDSGLKSASAG